MRKLFTIALAVSAVAANASIVDFEDLSNPGPSFTLYGDTVNSGGFTFTSVSHVGDTQAIAAWASDSPFYTGSNAIFANYFDDSLDMVKTGGGTFSVTSIGLADVFIGSTSGVVTFMGTHADSTTVTETVVLADGSFMTSYALSSMTNLVKMNIMDDVSSGVQIDNVNIEAVPEPASMAVLGLGAAALLRRRRKS